VLCLRRIEVDAHGITTFVSISSKSTIIVHIPLIQPHVFRHKSLQMEDLLTPHLAPVLIERRPLDDLGLQGIVRLGYQLPRQRLDDGCRVDAMRQQVVKGGADL
jgi:hypothetical protein